ncbi:unnamed protein product, partial [Bubo scandiacus]
PPVIFMASSGPPQAGLCPYTGDPRAEHSTPDGVSREQRGRITSLDLLAMLLLMKPRIINSFFF